MKAGLVVLGLLASGALAMAAEKRIDIWKGNPRYWEYGGRPVLLLGGSDEDNLFNNPALMRRNLDALAKCGGNYIRGTLSCRDEGDVWPFLKVGAKYDLNKPNPEFWRRLTDCLEEARKRDIIVQIEVWATFDFYRDIWRRNPFNPAMNVNYTTSSTKLKETWDYHPAQKPQPFFHSPPGLNNDRLVLRYQETFVRKLLDVALAFPNVLYCLDNETKAPKEWPHYWAKFVADEVKRRGARVHLTEMWDPWDLRDPRHANTYRYPKLFSFTDVSQNNWNSGQTHYDRLVWFRQNLLKAGGPRPMNNVKIYGAERPRKPRRPELNIDRFWKCVFAGCASARFHRPPTGIGLNEAAQRTIRAARTFTSAFDIFSTEPHNDLLEARETDEAYCVARPGAVYALYFPKGGAVRLKTKSEEHRVRWFDPRKASFVGERREKGPALELSSAGRGQSWLVLVQALGR